ncbi:DUF2927 domain-containing protein [Devosia oryziradicis]|uniref:DUF2927 domain-containing protein n=1 Tax=Devosia oryziradicis TaxID=2801335 RepID=A0ABX7C1C0_9HYPH|nr:DUF2927 domain-containing protein [Devosia oryziradicis]QQR36460.1 DUF2927 domain-containing protein [Devosia oryziradicis]
MPAIVRIDVVLALSFLLALPAEAACDVALSPADIDRAIAISIGAEYGDARAAVARWHRDVTVGVAGDARPEDRATLAAVVAELGTLIAPTRIRLVEGGADMLVQFAPVDEFSQLNPNYQPDNYGFFWMHWDGAGITDSDVLISTTGLTRAETDHLIREEVTQALGMANDLGDEADSIFYAPWTDTQAYSPSDTRVIRALYCADVRHGMAVDDFRDVLATQAKLLDPAEIAALQRALVARGHPISDAGGIVGDDTRQAIRAEQGALGLYADGEPNRGLIARLKVKL